ncbi:MAG TPA: hypothetical protein VF535_02220 [Allosphingosinicella sp.]|jgi:hypothetical protein
MDQGTEAAFTADADLKPLEKALIEAVERGEDFKPPDPGGARDCIRGELVRAMLLGTPLRHHPGRQPGAKPLAVRLTPHGLRIVRRPATPGARGGGPAAPVPVDIRGRLNLSGLAAWGGGYLPPLELSGCRFEQPIALCAAHLESLTLRGSLFSCLDAEGAKFNGNVVIDGCGPDRKSADPGERHFLDRELAAIGEGGIKRYRMTATGPVAGGATLCDCAMCTSGDAALRGRCTRCSCTIDFASAEITGGIDIRRTCLRAPGLIGRKGEGEGVRDERSAELSGIRVRDSIRFLRCSVIGSINLANAEIDDDVWIFGGKFLTAADRRAFDFQLATIGGLLAFTAYGPSAEDKDRDIRAWPVVVMGRVVGVGLEAGEVWISHGFFYGRDKHKRSSAPTINFAKSDIRRTFKIGAYHPPGMQAPEEDGGAKIHGDICLIAANIGKNFEIHDASPDGIAETLQLSGPLAVHCDAEAEAPFLTVSAEGMKVDRRLYLSKGRFRAAPPVRGSVEAQSAEPADGQNAASRPAVDLFKSTIGTGVRIDAQCRFEGAIRLNSCVIGREVIIACADVEPAPAADGEGWGASGSIPSLINLSDSTVRGHLMLGERGPLRPGQCAVTVRGGISLESTNIQGSALLGHITLDLRAFDRSRGHRGQERDERPEDRRVAVNLRDCTCGSDLEVKSLKWRLPRLAYGGAPRDRRKADFYDTLLFGFMGPRFGSIDQGFYAIIDMRGLNCALLHDRFGLEWGLVHRLQLRLAGVKIGDVEPASQGPVVGKGRRPAKRATLIRLRWLAFQNSTQEIIDEAEPKRLRIHSPAFHERYHCSSDADFVPQAYNVFASACRRSGEDRMADEIILEKKDIENALKFEEQLRRWRQHLWKPRRLVGIAAAAVALWAVTDSIGMMPRVPNEEASAGALIAGAFAALLAWPLISAGFQTVFRVGFRYGLSIDRALLTFLLCLFIGWLGTHYARNGGFAVESDWTTPLRKEVALVLEVEYQAEASVPPAVNERRGSHYEGRAVHARASPCNLDVSSLLYALDTFVPLLDLDQERRCTIRDSETRNGSDHYFGWRLAKAIYEVLGWIVTSLGLLTVTGLLRRDLER